MSKNQKASGITNIINYDNSGNISFVSGSTTLMSVSSSGAVVLTGTMSGGTADSASYAYTASSATNAFNSISASYSYTASSAINAFSASYAISSSYAATASFSNDFTVLGNLTVFGTQSVQYITSSQLNVSDNVITVNVASPGVRFGGLSVFDSGSLSSEATASLFWDSQNNHWIYQRESGSTYNGGMLISGPRNTGGLGNEQGTTSGSLMKGQGGDHVTSSAIFEDGYKATFYTNSLVVSSSGLVSMGTSNPATNRKLTVAGGAQFTYTDNGGASFNIVPGTNGQDGADLNLSYYTGTGYGPLTFTLGGSERMRIDSNGMIGIGTTPNAWYTGNNSKALQIGVPGVGIWGYGSTTNINTYLLNNAYYDAVGFKYAQASAKSSAYQQNNGVHIWSTTDTTGTSAGDTLSLTERMRIASDGKVGMGRTPTTYTLEVNGGISATSGFIGNASTSTQPKSIYYASANFTSGTTGGTETANVSGYYLPYMTPIAFKLNINWIGNGSIQNNYIGYAQAVYWNNGTATIIWTANGISGGAGYPSVSVSVEGSAYNTRYLRITLTAEASTRPNQWNWAIDYWYPTP